MPVIVWPLIVLMGWLAGVLVNYLADVLPLRRRLTAPFCLGCQSEMAWREYALWPRRCPVCQRRRGVRVWCVEVFFVLAAIWLKLAPPPALGFWLGFLLMIYLALVVVIDIEYRLILHPVSLVGLVLGLPLGIWLRAEHYATTHAAASATFLGVDRTAWVTGLWQCLLGGVVGFAIMWVLYFIGELWVRRLARTRQALSDEVALGFGDVILSTVLGLILGWPLVLLGLFYTIVLGGVVSLLYIVLMLALRRYHLFAALPYGPYLVAGTVLLLYFPALVP